jgi:penicillin-binding protein 1A
MLASGHLRRPSFAGASIVLQGTISRVSDSGHIARLDAWRGRRRERRQARPRVRKLRLALIVSGLAVLAAVSTLFGMMMAVASDLPKLENRRIFQLKQKRNSKLVDVRGRPLGILTSNQNVVLSHYDDVAPVMRNAMIAIEDARFYTNDGFDLRGTGRAFVQDIVKRGAVQGGSTITQQFVKNQLAAQGNRTILEKLREAALAYHLTRKWTKERILTEYLNSTYFGNGAYGVESAARVYFGKAHPGCGTTGRPFCAKVLTPVQAASLAGMVANPSGYDPLVNASAFIARRNTVLRRMLEQHYIRRTQYDEAIRARAPSQADLSPPEEKTASPYFTSWVRQVIVNRLGPVKAFYGNLKIYTSIDLDLQRAAENAVGRWLSGPGLPSASLVAIDNKTGEVRAMVGGPDYARQPFNLATQGQRQPGSSFKPFTLSVALEHGYTLGSSLSSRRKVFTVPHTRGKEKFVVNNYEGDYTGSNTLAGALAESDNSIFAELGIRVGTRRVARMAQRMGIRTPVSHNLAMTLGGLRQGVTPLDMAHAYETLAEGGQRVVNPKLGSDHGGPIGIHKIVDAAGRTITTNKPDYRRVMPPAVAQQVTQAMEGVVTSGTGRAAAIPGFAAGKTGTTENYGDAWFVGWNGKYTVAVWVGFPHSVKSMATLFHGAAVAGGTYPALIWHDFMTAAEALDHERHPDRPEPTTTATTPAPAVATPSYSAPATVAPATPAPVTPAPQVTPAPATPAPAPAPAPAGAGPAAGAGGTGTGGTGGTGAGTGGTGATGATGTGTAGGTGGGATPSG